jgi:hypothetical protein
MSHIIETPSTDDDPEPRQLVAMWEHLTDDQRETLIPRLLADTKLGTRIRSPLVPFTPRY